MSNFLDKTGLQHYTEKVKAYVDSKAGGVNTDLSSHIGNKKNPHEVTKEQVGLGNVTNVAQIPLSQKGAASGVATLGTDGKLTAAQLPAMKTVNGVSVVGSGNISIDLSLYKVVDSLPTTGIDATKIYIVPAKTTGDKNIKAEYVYTGNPASAYDATKWEKLGEAQTNIVVDADLSATSTNPIQNKAVKSAVDSLTSSVNSKVATSTYNTKMSALDSSISALQSKNTAQDSAIDKKLDKSAYVVDAELSETSTNPVQNKAIYDKFTQAGEIMGNCVQDILATPPLGIMPSTGTSWAIVPNPEKTDIEDATGGVRYTFNAALFATKEGLDSCLKKTDMIAITNEEIDAMF